MDKNELFKQLAKHYKLDEEDWWQHRQSGNWVLKHSAVQKLASMPTPEGYHIRLPEISEYVWHRSQNGGTFRLLKGQSPEATPAIRSAVAYGEANQSNLSKSVAYPNIMAVKRMLDRGILAVLAFNQLNVYSAEEAETFKGHGRNHQRPHPCQRQKKKLSQKSFATPRN